MAGKEAWGGNLTGKDQTLTLAFVGSIPTRPTRGEYITPRPPQADFCPLEALPIPPRSRRDR